MTTIKILQLYPDQMSLYGDNGNVLCLRRRLEWRGYRVEVLSHQPGQVFSHQPDIMVGGGGQDSAQAEVQQDLLANAEALKALVEAGVPTLLVCGLYQLFGQYFQTETGQRLQGAAILDAYTEAGARRLVGNVVVSTAKFGQLVGYENHSGRTFLGSKVKPLGTVIKGEGNNGQDGYEGVIYKNLIGTYCHGPVLPKNPKLADFLLQTALRRRQAKAKLVLLDDQLEQRARHEASLRPR